MHITDVETLHLRMPVVREICDGTQDALLIRVHTDAGIVGIGQAETSPHAGMAAIDAPISNSIGFGLREAAIGEDPREVARVIHKLVARGPYIGTHGGAALAAVSGIEMALWDILGRATGLPIHVLLGGAHRKQVPAYASMLFPEADDADPVATVAGQAARAVARGFRALKFGWGRFGSEPATDVAMVYAIREAVGSETAVMLDAGHCWQNAADAIEAVRQLEPFRPYWIEDPFPRQALEAYDRLGVATTARVAAGVGTPRQARDMLERGVAVVQSDAGSSGIGVCKQIGLAAAEVGGQYVPHCYGTGVLQAATLHMLAALPFESWLEFPFEASPLSRDLLTEGFEPNRGSVAVPDGPGLGIQLDEAVVEQYIVARSTRKLAGTPSRS